MLSTLLSQSMYSVISHNTNSFEQSFPWSGRKIWIETKIPIQLYNGKSFIIQVFLIDIYSRKGIHLKSGVFNSVSSATFTLIISIQQYNQPVALVEIFTDVHQVHLRAIYWMLIC